MNRFVVAGEKRPAHHKPALDKAETYADLVAATAREDGSRDKVPPYARRIQRINVSTNIVVLRV